jgi:WD40 repeat protein
MPIDLGDTLPADAVFTPDQATLVVAGPAFAEQTNDLQLWDVAGGSVVATIKTGVTDQSVFATTLAVSPNGNTFALGFTDGTTQLWDMGTLTKLATFAGEPNTEVRGGLAYSPDGTLLATGYTNGTIIVRDLATGQPVGNPLKEQTEEISSLAFTADNTRLMSGTLDSVVLWRLADERPIATIEGATSGAFSPDGNTLVTAGTSGSVLVWDLRIDSWRTAACQLAGRNLTRDEWSRYLPDEDYRTTCP